MPNHKYSNHNTLLRWLPAISILTIVFSISACSNDSTNPYEAEAATISLPELSAEMEQVRDYVPQHAVIAHRGTTYWAPEETEASWRWAREMGADYLEGDLQCTKDGIVLAIHDNTLLRTTDIARAFGGRMPEVRSLFYRSFRNPDGSQHFSDADIEAQVERDQRLGFNHNIRDYYYAELLMLDAGSWFNAENPDRAHPHFACTINATVQSLTDGSHILYGNGLYISMLQDMIAFAEGRKLNRDSKGRRILPYGITKGMEHMTLAQISSRSADSTNRYMDFVTYDTSAAYANDDQWSGNIPGIYIEFKETTLQPADIEQRVYDILDLTGWNILTRPVATSEPFYKNQCVNVGNTNGKVVLQTFSYESVLRVEELFAGKIPMCFLIDDEGPMSWDNHNDYSTPQMVRDVLTRMIEHKCHIIGPSVAGAPNNYPERNNPWQQLMVRRSGMLTHAWSIDNTEQMKPDMDGMFTNRTDMTLHFMKSHGYRDIPSVPDPEQVIKRVMGE